MRFKMTGIFASALSFLLTTTPVLAQTSSVTPTVAQFLNASNAQYILGGVPEGFKPFLVDGRQLKLRDVITGAVAATWITPRNQLVIAYQGTTGGENLITHPSALISQALTDAQVTLALVDVAAPALVSSLTFAKRVVAAGKAQGYAASNIFVTGHSLGGIEAEYVSSQIGLGGIGFESTGLGLIAAMGNTQNRGSNFVNVVTWGDTIGNISSDIPGNLLGYKAGSSGIFPHYGGIVMIGDQKDQDTLNALTLIPNFIKYHLPGVQAHDLGIQLNPYSAIVDNAGDMTGTVYSVGNATIPELVADAKRTGRYYPR
ncbi:hypothetical protein [Sphingomonas sp.]|uniref:hypothetical protein n=1 Tax=Sphingomonas sp. TaxID=28214 RepID=UPI002EDA87B8